MGDAKPRPRPRAVTTGARDRTTATNTVGSEKIKHEFVFPATAIQDQDVVVATAVKVFNQVLQGRCAAFEAEV